jgi:hypothetical protein
MAMVKGKLLTSYLFSCRREIQWAVHSAEWAIPLAVLLEESSAVLVGVLVVLSLASRVVSAMEWARSARVICSVALGMSSVE